MLPQLNFHIPGTDDIALVVMAYLSRDMDGIPDLYRLGVSIFLGTDSRVFSGFLQSRIVSD
jgi:hypothetical protein